MIFLAIDLELYTLVWWGFILGGLGIFLLGLSAIGEGLKKLAGQKLKSLIDRFAAKPWKGLLVGTFATVLVQSSSATTAMTIGLVKAGLMSLTQAVGIIMGANIGTTVTAFIIGLKVSSIAPFILLLGAFLTLFANRPKSKHIGEALFGFGAIFFGLYLMELALKPLARLPEFISLIESLHDQPWLGLLIGTVGTAAIQSSSAFIGILQGLVAASNDFDLLAALPILFGANIGTTITAILASFGDSLSAKRTALVHVIFNLVGTALFMLILIPYSNLLIGLFDQWNVDPKMQVAYAHITFNVVTSLLLLPLSFQLVKIVTILIPGKEVADEMAIDLHELERDVIEIAPSAALEITKRQALVMGEMAHDTIVALHRYFLTKVPADRERVLQGEAQIDRIFEKLTDFLNGMRHTVLEDRDVLLYSEIMHAIKDIERLGDHAENLIEFLDEIDSRGEVFNDSAKQDISGMLQTAIAMVRGAIDAFRDDNLELAQKIIIQDDELDTWNAENRNRHIKRFRDGAAENSRYISMVFIDLLSNIERLGDHSVNISDAVVDLVQNR